MSPGRWPTTRSTRIPAGCSRSWASTTSRASSACKGATLAGLKLGATFLCSRRAGFRSGTTATKWRSPAAATRTTGVTSPAASRSTKPTSSRPLDRTPDESDLFDHIRRLTKLRADLPALRRGQTRVLLAQGQQLVYARTHESQTVLVALNNDADKTARLTVDVSELKLPTGAKLADALAGKTVSVSGPCADPERPAALGPGSRAMNSPATSNPLA